MPLTCPQGHPKVSGNQRHRVINTRCPDDSSPTPLIEISWASFMRPASRHGVTLAQAAQALGERTKTLRRWVRNGAPVVAMGRKGRGYATLVDLEQIRSWRQSQTSQRQLLEFASRIPGLLSDATYEAFADWPSSPAKARAAELAALVWL